MKKKYFKAFTLVELIIVITILSILATIAFVSFQNYTASARDSSRLASLTNIEKGLDIYSIQVGNLPTPTNPKSFTGGQTGNLEIKQGKLTKEVLHTLSSTPLDPVSKEEYTYSIFGNGKYYQVAANLEKQTSQNITQRSYANTKIAKLVGNYRYDPSLPSLIIGSGSNIFSPDTCFVVNGGTNTTQNCLTKKSDLAGSISDSSLVGYWDMESLTGTLLKDLSGNGNHGIFSGNILPQEKNGYFGKSYEFFGQGTSTGTNFSLIYTQNDLDLGQFQDFTLDVFINSNLICPELSEITEPIYASIVAEYSNNLNNNTGAFLLSESDFSNDSFAKNCVTSGGLRGSILTPDFYIIRDLSSTKNNVWKKLTLKTEYVDNSKILSLFIDGRKIGDNTSSHLKNKISVQRTLGKLYIGSRASGKFSYSGIIDEIKIYNRALSDEEILQQAKISGF